MKKIFYPKFIFPLVQLIFILFFVFMLLFFINSLIKNRTLEFDFFNVIGLIIYISFVCLVIFHLIYFLSFHLKLLIIKDEDLSIFELNKFGVTHLKMIDIEGYSKSEVYFGKYIWKSKSIVIYFKNGMKSEFANIFVMKFHDLVEELQRNKIKYFGFESYQTGWFYREYKFGKNKE